MDRHQSQGSRFVRILVALGVFVCGLSGVLYLGFGIKFQPLNIKGFSSNITAAQTASSKPLFYNSIGKAPAKQLSSNSSHAIGKRFTLEIKMTENKQEAERLVDQLAEMGVQAYYTPLQNNGRVVFRVRRGIYPNETLAMRAASELRQKKKLATRVIQLQ